MGLRRISASVRFSERAAPLRRDCVFFCVDEEWLEEFETTSQRTEFNMYYYMIPKIKISINVFNAPRRFVVFRIGLPPTPCPDHSILNAVPQIVYLQINV